MHNMHTNRKIKNHLISAILNAEDTSMTCAEFSTEKFRTQDIFTHAIQTIERTQILKYPECSPHSLHREKKKKGIQNILYPKKAASVILLKCSSDHVIVLFKTPRPCPFTLGCDGIGRKETLARNFGPSYFSYHMTDYPQHWSLSSSCSNFLAGPQIRRQIPTSGPSQSPSSAGNARLVLSFSCTNIPSPCGFL